MSSIKRVHRYILVGIPKDKDIIKALYPLIKSGIIDIHHIHMISDNDKIHYAIANVPIDKQTEFVDALLKEKIITKKKIKFVEEDERNSLNYRFVPV